MENGGVRRGSLSMEDSLLDTKNKNAFLHYFSTSRNARLNIGIATSLLFLLFLIIFISVRLSGFSHRPQEPINVIFMITDGFGPASETMARIVKASELNPNNNAPGHSLTPAKLPLDGLLKGTVSTYSSDSYVTDSAAGATAYSCGMKTYNAAIGVDDNRKPCGTLMEAAKTKGMATGLVATSRITHATPASFSSHSIHRDLEDFIAKQQVDMGVDVLFGGGKNQFTNRADGLNLFDYATEKKGYKIVQTVPEFEAVDSTPVLGIFAKSHMSFDIDRDPTKEPSLAQMTTKALSLLEKKSSGKGFFLMVEGSRIDMAGHNNDPMAHYRDIIAYNDALKVVLDYVEKHPRTLVISTSDHETGGLTLGSNNREGTYPTYDWYPQVVWKAKASTEKMADLILKDKQSPSQVLKEYAQIDVDSYDMNLIQKALNGSRDNLITTLGGVVSYKALIAWTTWGHSGTDTNLYATGYSSANIAGNYNNIDIGNYVKDLLNLDLEAETKRLSTFNPAPSSSSRVYNSEDSYSHNPKQSL